MVVWLPYSRRDIVIIVVVHIPIRAFVQRKEKVVENAVNKTIFRKFVGESMNENPPSEIIRSDTVKSQANDL